MINTIILVAVLADLALTIYIGYRLQKLASIVEVFNKTKPGRKWCRIHRTNFDVTADSIECPKCKDR